MSFIKDFYSGLSFEYWQSRIDYELKRVIAEQDSLSASAIIGAYSSYLQLAEIVFHHIYLILTIVEGEESFKTAVFIKNNELKEWIDKSMTEDVLTKFLKTFVFSTVKEAEIDKNKFKDYLNILLEVKNDFLKYHDVLNAFKHGFRIRASDKGSVAIKGHQVLATEAVVTYFSKQDKTIYRNTFGFSVRRTLTKAHFVFSTIENARILINSKPEEILNQEHYFIDDREAWSRTFGSYYFKSPI